MKGRVFLRGIISPSDRVVLRCRLRYGRRRHLSESVPRLKLAKNHSANMLGEPQDIFSLIFLLLVAAWKQGEVFHGSKVGGVYVLFKNPVPYSSLIGNSRSFLKSVLFHLFMMLAEMPRQY